ncbi:ribose-phosphate diphosphokinase [Caenimonas sp. SL110]|uniref:ribose-phosphate diphosphokinase n=1 Tax=Caenimonas sp. SL110 TaxID=1450524 RepID=UPI0006542A1D|nr:ribose-phosphate diphosphokinase [Caenimonas sp. SL110]
MLIVALPGGIRLAAALSGLLGCECSPLAVHTFPDGETSVRIDAPVAGRRVVFAGSLHHPDARTLPLLFAADAARELGATSTGLVAPYLAYMRQDARFRPGEAITSRTYARMLSQSLDLLITVDPHLHRWHALGEIYSIPTQAVAAAPAIAAWLVEHVRHPLIVGPDAESEQWVSEVARLAGAPWTVLSKKRHGDRDVSVYALDQAAVESGAWHGHTPVLLDDIVSSGETLVAASAALQHAGLGATICIAVHALFATGALERMRGAGIARIVSCDTIEHETNAIELAPLLADALTQALASP